MNHATLGRECFDHRVIKISRSIAQRPTAGMRRDHGRAGSLQNVVKCRIGNVRNIDEHSKPVHFPITCFPKSVSPLWRGASFEESAHSVAALCVSVMYRTPRA